MLYMRPLTVCVCVCVWVDEWLLNVKFHTLPFLSQLLRLAASEVVKLTDL